MLELAVATRAETFERMRGPLADRGVRTRAIQPSERTFPLTDPPDDLAGFDVGFVYPPRLMEGGVVDAFLDVAWVNGPRAVLTSRNKAEVLARLGRAGLPVPETVLVSDPVEEADVVAAFERFDPPVVVKPNSGTRGLGVTKVHDVDSLLGVVDYLELIHGFEATGDKAYLLQEFLPDVRDYRVMVVDGTYAGAVERRLPADGGAAGRWTHNVHRDAEPVGVDLGPDNRRLAERVAEVLGIDFLGVDVLVSDGVAYVGETNARPTIDEPGKYEPDFFDRLAELVRSRA